MCNSHLTPRWRSQVAMSVVSPIRARLVLQFAALLGILVATTAAAAPPAAQQFLAPDDDTSWVRLPAL